MKMDRSKINRTTISEDKSDGYIDSDKVTLFSIMWEITQDAWAFARRADAKHRLQRDVGNLIRPGS